jgi:hypothetical protein
VRYIEFVTPKRNIARIRYPNFFDIPVSDIAGARNWLREQSQTDWKAIIDRETTTTLDAKDIQANTYLAAGALPATPIDWNIYVSDDMITRILQSKKWLNPDIALKYQKSIRSMLSYSQESIDKSNIINTPPTIPSTSNEYEIAYL